MKIWHISDTHNSHHLLSIPKDVNMVIFSGDESNPRDPYNNEPEARDFIKWFAALPIKHKIFVAGNHSSAIASGLISKQVFIDKNIIYLENDWVVVDGVKIYGSPYSPTFGNWVFMRARHKMQELWAHIPDDTDIVVTHTPPKGCLDLSYNRNGELEFCGCKSLLNRVLQIKPKLCLYGHIHSMDNVLNAGTMKLANYNTVFSNGSVVTDGKFGKVSSHGNLLEL